MPRADSWAPALTELLPGAAAPRFFLAGLERQIAGLDALRRAAAWLPALLAQRPRLSDAPLFGHTLAAAVQAGEGRAETASPGTAAAPAPLPAAPDRRRSRAAGAVPMRQEEPPVARSRALAAALRLPTARERTPLPARIRTRAERALLAALAGGIPVGLSSTWQAAGWAFAQGMPSAGRHLPIGAESGRLVQHLARHVLAGALAAGASAVGLAGQWTLPLVGQGVSRAFLAAVLQQREGQARLPAAAPGQQGQGARAQEQDPGRPRRQAIPPSPTAAGQGSAAQPFAGASRPFMAWRPSGETAPVRASLRRRPPLAEEIEPGAGPAGQPADLSGKEATLAPLPGSAGTPGTRFFASLRQQRPPQEACFDRSAATVSGAAADDLDDLAAKLQRILEEQARRYGIDV